MKKQEYLKNEEIISFTNWIAEQITSPTGSTLHNSYVTRKPKHDFAFNGISDALKSYAWGFSEVEGLFPEGSTYADNEFALGLLEKNLIESIKTNNQSHFCKACVDVVKWGGVSAHNKKWLESKKENLIPEILKVLSALKNDDDDFKIDSIDFRFNAGMTKIYSLLLPNFVIYDSRVAASLAWLVLQWSRKSQIDVPGILQFPCMPAKESTTTVHRKIRNPDTTIFPALNNNHLLHAKWNLRASWLIEAIAMKIKDKNSEFSTKSNPVRALEAALFMWGYDLSGCLN